MGSIERFVGILIEEYAGNMPLWLAPTQIVLMNITSGQDAYLDSIAQKLSEKGFRVTCDNRNEKISLKIRENTLAKIPYLLIVGNKEMESNTISVRTRFGKDMGQMTVDKFVKMLETLVRDKSLTI